MIQQRSDPLPCSYSASPSLVRSNNPPLVIARGGSAGAHNSRVPGSREAYVLGRTPNMGLEGCYDARWHVHADVPFGIRDRVSRPIRKRTRCRECGRALRRVIVRPYAIHVASVLEAVNVVRVPKGTPELGRCVGTSVQHEISIDGLETEVRIGGGFNGAIDADAAWQAPGRLHLQGSYRCSGASKDDEMVESGLERS